MQDTQDISVRVLSPLACFGSGLSNPDKIYDAGEQMAEEDVGLYFCENATETEEDDGAVAIAPLPGDI